MKTTSSDHVVYTNCFLFLYWHSEQFMYTTCSELVVFMYWTGKLMNNLLSYCGLVDTRIRASDIDLPVLFFLLLKKKRKNSIVWDLENICESILIIWNWRCYEQVANLCSSNTINHFCAKLMTTDSHCAPLKLPRISAYKIRQYCERVEQINTWNISTATLQVRKNQLLFFFAMQKNLNKKRILILKN